MSKTIHFAKMSGAGNDFVVIDNRQGVVPEPASAFAAKVCARQAAIGADGLLLLEKSSRKNFRMRYFNSDGSEADMCGNGARCLSRFSFQAGVTGKSMEFETKAGDFKSRLEVNGEVRLEMPAPKSLQLNIGVKVDGQDIPVHFLDTGVPHILLETRDISTAPVEELGRVLRRHEAFAPQGTNVNFAQVLGPDAVSVRTYERGVEGETLACGTGSVASAILLALLGRVKPPVKVTTRSGSVLTVHFRLAGNEASEVALEGPAVTLCEGEIILESFGY